MKHREDPRADLLCQTLTDFARKCSLLPPDVLSEPADIFHDDGGGR